jgi:undecaprenyl-diphosphatase
MMEPVVMHPTPDVWRIRPHTVSGREALAATPWLLIAAGWVVAYAVGAASAAAVHAAGWWPGAPWERAMLGAAQDTINPALDVVMLSLPYIGTNYSLVPFVVLAAILLWRRGYPTIALHLAIAQAGSWMLNPALKFSFPRDRPDLFEARGQHAFPAFPSGHAIAVMGVLFTVAYLIHRCGRGTWAYWAVGAFLVLNSYSRIYLSVHWPTDVIAGVGVGAVWLVWMIVAFRRLHGRARG